MKVILALCAELTSIDRSTNKLSIFNVADHITPLTFPFWIARMVLVLNLQREGDEPDDGVGRLKIYHGDSILTERDVRLKFRSLNEICKVVLNFDAAVPAPGELIFKIGLADKEHEVYRLPVTQPRNPGQQTDLNFGLERPANTAT